MDNWSDEKKIEYLTAFGLFDIKKEGFIDLSLLSKAIENLGYKLSNEDIREIIKEVDIDNTGTIELSEFAQLMENKMKDNDSDEEISESFKIFDKKNRGIISKDDIKHVLESLHEKVTPQELTIIMQKYDEDNDGFLNFEEFKRMLQDN